MDPAVHGVRPGDVRGDTCLYLESLSSSNTAAALDSSVGLASII